MYPGPQYFVEKERKAQPCLRNVVPVTPFNGTDKKHSWSEGVRGAGPSDSDCLRPDLGELRHNRGHIYTIATRVVTS